MTKLERLEQEYIHARNDAYAALRNSFVDVSANAAWITAIDVEEETYDKWQEELKRIEGMTKLERLEKDYNTALDTSHIIRRAAEDAIEDAKVITDVAYTEWQAELKRLKDEQV